MTSHKATETSGHLISWQLLHDGCLEPVSRVDAERLKVCACVMANQRLLSLGILS